MRADRLLILVLVLLLLASAAVALWLWRELEGVTISEEGWLALAGGVAATLLLGIGLMTLVYWSHKRGFDERAGHDRAE